MSHKRKLSINRIVKENKNVEYKKDRPTIRLYGYTGMYTVYGALNGYLSESHQKKRAHTATRTTNQ